MIGVVIYFILWLASIVISIVSFNMGAEWWVGAIFIALSFLALIMALAKLDDETMVISNAISNIRKKKATKIAKGECKTEPLYMVNMFIKSYEDRKDISNAYIRDRAAKNIASSFNELLKNWELVFDESDFFKKLETPINNVEDIKKYLISSLEDLFAMNAFAGDNFDGGYAVYSQVFEKLSFPQKTKTEMKKLSNELFADKSKKAGESVSFFMGVSRRSMSAFSYERLVQGFCDMSLVGGVVHEDEYNFVKIVFFSKDYGDIYPETWEQFKSEYK